eukprot:164180-Pelagomonas_calceolata.AAC.4
MIGGWVRQSPVWAGEIWAGDVCLAKIQILEKETHWIRKAVSPLHHKATDLRVLMGIGRVPGSTGHHKIVYARRAENESTPHSQVLEQIDSRTLGPH